MLPNFRRARSVTACFISIERTVGQCLVVKKVVGLKPHQPHRMCRPCDGIPKNFLYGELAAGKRPIKTLTVMQGHMQVDLMVLGRNAECSHLGSHCHSQMPLEIGGEEGPLRV